VLSVARLAIDKDFLDDYSKLPKPVQSSVKTAIDKFAEHIHAGLHLEKTHPLQGRSGSGPSGSTSFWRGVVLAPDAGDTYSLIRVMPHDKAIDYAASHRFTVNQALGVVEVRDEAPSSRSSRSLSRAAQATDDRLFKHVSDADLARLGIDENTRTIAPAAHLGRAPGRDAAHDPRGPVQRALPAGRRPPRSRTSGRRSRSTPPASKRPAFQSIPATWSRRWSARLTAWSSSRATRTWTRSLSTRSRPGGSSCTRRSARSPTVPATQARPR